jgi:type I restriction enzyme S subunit
MAEVGKKNIHKLISELCPEGVERQALSKVTQKVSTIKWYKTSSAEYGYIDLSSVDRQTFQVTITTTITANNAPSRARQILTFNDVIFATTRPLQNRRALIQQEYEDHICSTGYCVLRTTNVVLPAFVFHILGTQDFREHVEANQSEGGAYPAIRDAAIKEYLIPIPPISVQEAIVAYLDKFSQLEAELEAELVRRKKQYEWYRMHLLDFRRQDVDENGESTGAVLDYQYGDEYQERPAIESMRKMCSVGVKYCPLDEVFDIRNGYTPSKSNEQFWNDGTVPWYKRL